MTIPSNEEHNRRVHAFFEECKQTNPDLYEEVCNRFPIISAHKMKRIRHKEYLNGLLGLQSNPHTPTEVANLYGKDVLDVNE